MWWNVTTVKPALSNQSATHGTCLNRSLVKVSVYERWIQIALEMLKKFQTSFWWFLEVKGKTSASFVYSNWKSSGKEIVLQSDDLFSVKSSIL